MSTFAVRCLIPRARACSQQAYRLRRSPCRGRRPVLGGADRDGPSARRRSRCPMPAAGTRRAQLPSPSPETTAAWSGADSGAVHLRLQNRALQGLGPDAIVPVWFELVKVDQPVDQAIVIGAQRSHGHRGRSYPRLIESTANADTHADARLRRRARHVHGRGRDGLGRPVGAPRRRRQSHRRPPVGSRWLHRRPLPHARGLRAAGGWRGGHSRPSHDQRRAGGAGALLARAVSRGRDHATRPTPPCRPRARGATG